MSSEQPKTYSVSQYNGAIQRRLAEIPSIWIQGVITQLKVRDPMVYLTLAEFKPNQEKPVATLDLCCWSKEWRQFESHFSHLDRPLVLGVEMKVALLVKSDFYVPWGRFQPHILAINPEFTLGEMALTRERIISALRRDGLLDLNKSIDFPSPALQIGVITAPNSAAYADFCDVLNHSPYAFHIVPIFAKMQGDRCAQSIIQAMGEMKGKEIDLLCILRGGGAKTDLIYFDNEELCKAIALFPLPVLTGIGHQIDLSIADRVAWQHFITPTDCGRFLVNAIVNLSQEIQDLSRHLLTLANRRVQVYNEDWNELNLRLQNGVRGKIQSQQWRLHHFKMMLQNVTKQRLASEKHRLEKQHLQLDLLNPKRLLAKGWSLSLDAQNNCRIDWSKIQVGQEIKSLTHEGTIHSKIISWQERSLKTKEN